MLHESGRHTHTSHTNDLCAHCTGRTARRDTGKNMFPRILTRSDLAHKLGNVLATKSPSEHAWPEAFHLNVRLLDELGHASSIDGQAIVDQDERSVGAGKGVGADL